MRDNETATLLDRAADILADRGWCRGTTFDSATGCMCMLGAAGAAQTGTDRGCYPSLDVEAVMFNLLPLDYPGTRGVGRTNDFVIASKREAVTALRRMARRLRGQKVRPLKRNLDPVTR